MNADLIERLRACADYFEKFYGRTKTVEAIREAADALAAKDTALSEMRAELELVKDYHRNCSDEAQRLLSEKHDLLAELALARKALKPFQSASVYAMKTGQRPHDFVIIEDFHAAHALASQDEGEER